MLSDARILFPTEFGPLGEKAERQSVHLAKLYGAELVLLHAFHLPAGISRLFSDVNESEARRRSQSALDEYAKRLRQWGAPKVTTMVRSGNRPEQVIVSCARDLNAGLVIFGTKGGTGLKDKLLGSAVNHVIRQASCPVLTIRHPLSTPGFRMAVVPVDLSKEAPQIVLRAIEWAQHLGSGLHFCGVGSEKGGQKKEIKARLEEAMGQARSAGLTEIEGTALPPSNRPGEAVVRFAESVKADLICCLTQSGDSDFKSNLRGSTADWITNHSPTAVLSINPVPNYFSSMWESLSKSSRS